MDFPPLKKSTLSSSAPVERELVAVSPAARAWLFAHDDELQQRRASDHARGARMREIRSAKLEAAVTKAVENHRLPFLATEPSERASWLQGKMDLRPGDYNLQKAPDIKTMRRILRELGILSQNAPTD